MPRASDNRKRILDATWKLLREDPAGTRMEDVARAAGVSRQAVYLHFSDRASLLTACAQHVDEQLSLDQRIAPIQRARTGEEALDRLAEFLGDYNPLIADVVRAFELLQPDAAARTAIIDRTENRRRGMVWIMTLLRDQDRLAEGWTPNSAADLATALSSVSFWRELVVERGWTSAQFVRHLKRVFRLTFVRPTRTPRPKSSRG